MTNYTLIARHAKDEKSEVQKYSFVDEQRKIVSMSTAEVINGLANKKFTCSNVDLDKNGKLHGSNGSLDRYPLYDADGKPVIASCVILGRLETNGTLTGYTVMLTNGAIKNVSAAQAGAWAAAGKIANGKVRHTSAGDVVAAISGNYPIDNYKKTLAIDLIKSVKTIYMVRSINAKKEKIEYAAVIIEFNSVGIRDRYEKALSGSHDAVIKYMKSSGVGDVDMADWDTIEIGVQHLFIVIEMSEFEKLEKHLVKDKALALTVVIPESGDRQEATAVLAPGWGAVEKADDRAKAFANEIVEKFGNK